MHTPHERIVVSLGGSLLIPDQVDTQFLKDFCTLIREKVADGFSFAIITGGGKTARSYQAAARAVTDPSRNDLDWLGIHATRINAHLLRTALADIAHAHVIKNPNGDIETDKSVIVAAGWHTGASTDHGAVLVAKNLGSHTVVNLTDTDHVYDKDPKKHKDAKKFEKMSWSEFRQAMPDYWDPGLSAPFDPVAAKEAEMLGLEVAIINGHNLDRFEQYLENKPFVGTIIS